MTNLSPEQQQVVDKAAKDYAEKSNTNIGQYGNFLDSIKKWAAADFTEGVTFALSTPSLYMGLMEELLEWIAQRGGDHKISLNDHDWYYESDTDGDFPISAGQLAGEFIEHKNKKEDGEEV